jgi:hypothetical protein
MLPTAKRITVCGCGRALLAADIAGVTNLYEVPPRPLGW